MSEPTVTTPDFTPAEQAAWRAAVDRGLPVEAADLRAMVNAAAPLIAAAERECIRELAVRHDARSWDKPGQQWQPSSPGAKRVPFADLIPGPEAR